MKILVVHEVSYQKKVIFEVQILPELFSLLGHDVTFVDLDDTPFASPRGPVFDLAPRRHSDLHRVYPDAGITLRHPGVVRLPLISRVSSAVTASIEIVSALRETQFDAMLLFAVPTLGVQSILAARRYGVPVFFRALDVSHEIVPSRLLSAPTRAIERYVYNRVRGVSVLTPRLKLYIHSYGVPESRIRVQPGGVDVGMFSPGRRNDELLAEWGIGHADPVVLFMGTIYRFSGLNRVITDFPRLLARHQAARLLIVGHGEDEDRLKNLVAGKGLERSVVFTGVQPYELLPDFIRSADICINPFELTAVTRDIMPTKLAQYLACGKPLVATELPGTLPFLPGESHGVVYTDLDNFVDRLADLIDDSARCAELGRIARATAERDFDWEPIAGSLLSWMEERL